MKTNDHVLTVRTRKDLATVSEDLQNAVVKHQFGVMGIHNLKETMAKKGVEFVSECRIFEVCNPHQAKNILEQNMAISTALPCRISVYQDGDETVMATLRPTALLQLFGTSSGTENVAEEVEETIRSIMTEAAI